MNARRTAISTVTIAVAAIIAVAAGVSGAWMFLSTSPTSSSGFNPNLYPSISLQNFGLETQSAYPTPYLFGDILTNTNAQITGYTLSINSTHCGARYLNETNTAATVTEIVGGSTTIFHSSVANRTSTWTGTLFVYHFKGTACTPITAGKTYRITLGVTFASGVGASSQTMVTAV